MGVMNIAIFIISLTKTNDLSVYYQPSSSPQEGRCRKSR